jgi:signal transduction histidine kinase
LYDQQRELEHKNNELSKLNDEKNYFLGVASHDLRNPLGNMITLASFMQQEVGENLPTDHKQYLEIIISSGRHMLALLDNLLDISKIESGQMSLDMKEIQVNDIIQHVMQENKATAQRKQISLEYSTGYPLPTISLDKTQIQQALSNLVSNAIKYSFPNTVVEITAEKKDEHLVISVIDQGQGIPETELNSIFTPFARTSVQSTAGEKSTGLGLTIVKKVIEAHGGQIWINSKVGVGSTFSFSIPLIEKTVQIHTS